MTGDESSAAWTEIEWTVLDPAERAENAPADTRGVPYLARARGLASDPVVGKEAEIRTVTGRVLRGTVSAVGAGHGHGFGSPLPAWVHLKERIRSLLREAFDADGEGGPADERR